MEVATSGQPFFWILHSISLRARVVEVQDLDSPTILENIVHVTTEYGNFYCLFLRYFFQSQNVLGNFTLTLPTIDSLVIGRSKFQQKPQDLVLNRSQSSFDPQSNKYPTMMNLMWLFMCLMHFSLLQMGHFLWPFPQDAIWSQQKVL